MLRLTSLASALLLVGCANQGDEGMIIRNNTAVSGESCELSGDVGQPFIAHGQIWGFAPIGYTLTPLLQSRISLAATGTDMADAIQKTIQLRSADVSLTLKAVSVMTGGNYTVTQPETNVGQFSQLFSGALPPDGSVNVSFEVITPPLLRQIMSMTGADPATSSINAEVLAEVVVRGELNGDDVATPPFYYPITVCDDCIVVNVGACPVGVEPRRGNACNPYQDGVLDCCTDANNNLVCPAMVGSN